MIKNNRVMIKKYEGDFPLVHRIPSMNITGGELGM